MLYECCKKAKKDPVIINFNSILIHNLGQKGSLASLLDQVAPHSIGILCFLVCNQYGRELNPFVQVILENMDLLFPQKEVNVTLLVALRELLDNDNLPCLVFGTTSNPNDIHPGLYSRVGVNFGYLFFFIKKSH